MQIIQISDLYSKLTEILSIFLDKHIPIKIKGIGRNHAHSFMNKELSEILMEKSKARNKYLKLPSKENYEKYKKIKTNNILQ